MRREIWRKRRYRVDRVATSRTQLVLVIWWVVLRLVSTPLGVDSNGARPSTRKSKTRGQRSVKGAASTCSSRSWSIMGRVRKKCWSTPNHQVACRGKRTIRSTSWKSRTDWSRSTVGRRSWIRRGAADYNNWKRSRQESQLRRPPV